MNSAPLNAPHTGKPVGSVAASSPGGNPKAPLPPRPAGRFGLTVLALLGGLTIGAGVAVLTLDRWQPLLVAKPIAAPEETETDYPDSLPSAVAKAAPAHDDHAGHAAHDDHGSGEAGHSEHDANMLALSGAARKNVGVKLMTLRLKPYERTITIPGLIVERPGRTRIDVPAPLAGVVTKIYRVVGEAIEPGEPLFDLRLRDDDLVSAQAEYLLTVEQLAVVDKELARLASVGTDVVARKQV
ncbi:MAG TPA: hypothetical protein VGE52_22415, partial [Pirellulales bacterium]